MTDAEYAALPREVYVAVDVGGTNTRVNVGSVRGTVRVVKFQSHAKGTLLAGLDAAGRLLREKAPHVAVLGAAVCLAGPVLAGRSACSITNYEGEDKVVTLTEFPPSLFPPGKVLLLNDLEATCYGLIALQHPECVPCAAPMCSKCFRSRSTRQLGAFFETAWGGQPPSLQPDRKYCVLAVGTGLGSAAILWNSDLRTFSVVPLEAGHTFVPAYGDAHPLRREEESLFAFLAERHSQRQHPPEYESFASGKARGGTAVLVCSASNPVSSLCRVCRICTSGPRAASSWRRPRWRGRPWRARTRRPTRRCCCTIATSCAAPRTSA